MIQLSFTTHRDTFVYSTCQGENGLTHLTDLVLALIHA